MVWSWFKSFMPEKAKEDPTVQEISAGIVTETKKLKKAIGDLDKEVASMSMERVAMNNMLDQAVALVARNKKR